jgi:hypothetical protein
MEQRTEPRSIDFKVIGEPLSKLCAKHASMFGEPLQGS